MSTKVIYNIVIVAFIWLLVVAAGVYVTMFQQPEELARVEKAEKVIKLKQAELESLLSEQSASAEKADTALRKWRARYKVIPQSLSGPEVIGYMNELTKTGFEVFDVSSQGSQNAGDYSFHSFEITGRGYFTELYRIVWELENNRYFYRIPELTLVEMDLISEDPETGNDRMQIMVSFDMRLDAIYGGAEGMSAPSEGAPVEANAELPVSRAKSERPPVPMEVLPNQRPALNPFFPLIMDQIPPNTHGLIDVEASTLISIVGGKAIFQEAEGYRSAGVGDDVYLGQILEIDPLEGRVLVRLNKGGIIDEVELFLQTGEESRQALGSMSIAPVIVD